ncbi:MAG: hypothetical protein ACI9C4_000953 [Paraglaciecola sp.]|jgi:hypothetical protein
MHTILIAIDSTEDTIEVQGLRAENYQNFFDSTNPDTTLQDFAAHWPEI